MAETIRRHEYKPAKMNPFRCEECPYLRGNPIHTRAIQDSTVYIKGTAHPNKLG